MLKGCMCLCKDTNFKANHNPILMITCQQTVVCAYAKILILKQITTAWNIVQMSDKLYVPMQRY